MLKIKETFASRFNKAINLRGLKQVDICNRTGIKKSAMSQYVHGGFVPKQEPLQKIAIALDVSEIWLLGYDAPMSRDSINLSTHESILIYAYRKQSDIQPAVDRLLGIEKMALSPAQDNSVKLAAFGDGETTVPDIGSKEQRANFDASEGEN